MDASTDRMNAQCCNLQPSVPTTTTTSGLRVLTTHANAPVMAKTTMQAHLLHPLDVFAQALIQEIRVLLRGLAILDVALTIQHICWDLELQWISNDSDDLVDFICGKFTCALVHINVALFADDVRE